MRGGTAAVLAVVAAWLAGCSGPAANPGSDGTPAPGAAGMPAPGEEAGELLLQGVSHYRDGIGYLHVVGEVVNRGATGRSVQVEARLTGADGASWGTTFTYACLPVVPAGERSGFHLQVRDRDAAVASWALTPVPGAQGTAVQLLVEGASAVDAQGHERITGTVTNPGPDGASRVKVCATLLDGDGFVADVVSAAPEPSDLAPGGAGAFEARSLRQGSPSAERRLAAQPSGDPGTGA